MNKKRFIFLFFLISALVLSAVSYVNFKVDPLTVYKGKNFSDGSLRRLADAVQHSEYGVYMEGLGERPVKLALSTKAGEYECVMFGSSPIVTVSNIQTPNMVDGCGTILNLGASLCAIEDMAIFTYMMTKNDTMPKKVYISAPDWFFKLRANKNYVAYKDILEEYSKMFHAEGSDTEADIKYLIQKIKNLVNIEYFIKSIKYFVSNDQNAGNQYKRFEDALKKAEKDYVATGGEKNIILPDGSLLYTAKHREKHFPKLPFNEEYDRQLQNFQNMTLADFSEEEIAKVYTKEGWDFSYRLIEVLKELGVEVHLVLNPHYTNNLPSLEYVRELMVLELLVKKFAKETSVRLHGSAFSNFVGCTQEEFYDKVHPRQSCAVKTLR